MVRILFLTALFFFFLSSERVQSAVRKSPSKKPSSKTPTKKPVQKPVAVPKRSSKPTYKPVEVSYCANNSHVVLNSECRPTCGSEPFGNCQCSNCPIFCNNNDVYVCEDGYECQIDPIVVPFKESKTDVSLLDTSHESLQLSLLPVPPACDDNVICTSFISCTIEKGCVQTEQCYHKYSPCKIVSKRICQVGGPCYTNPVRTCRNTLLDCNLGCTCDSERQVCDATSCCKCDPGFYSPRGNPPARCLPCPRGSASSSPGAVGGCPCLPGFYSASGLGPCFPRLCDPTVPGALC